MAAEQWDPDALLVHRLFGPDAPATRAGLDREVVEQFDEAATDVLHGRDLGALSEAEAEAVTREMARRLRSILREQRLQLDASTTALRAEVQHLDAESEELRKRQEEIERRIEGGCVL